MEIHTEPQRFLSSEFLFGEIIQTSDVSQTSVVCLQQNTFTLAFRSLLFPTRI